MSYKDRFKKFGGEQIPDVIEYIKGIMEREPGSVVSVGCDSIQVRRRTIYAVTVMIYDTEIKKGAHVVFFRESCPKIRETQERLYKEAQFLHDVGTWINNELEAVGVTRNLPELEKRKYKYHLQKCTGEYSNVELHNEEAVVRNLIMLDSDLLDMKVIDLHADFNPFESSQYDRGHRNKSFIAYKSYIPWLRGLGFRVWVKPMGFASTSAADLLLKG